MSTIYYASLIKFYFSTAAFSSLFAFLPLAVRFVFTKLYSFSQCTTSHSFRYSISCCWVVSIRIHSVDVTSGKWIFFIRYFTLVFRQFTIFTQFEEFARLARRTLSRRATNSFTPRTTISRLTSLLRYWRFHHISTYSTFTSLSCTGLLCFCMITDNFNQIVFLLDFKPF